MKKQGYPGFADIPDVGGPIFNAVKTCYEFGWLDPVSEKTFGVQEPLTKAEMVTLLARLYSVRHGGRGEIPELPEDLGDYVRFYDADGALVHNLTTAYCPDFCAVGSREIKVMFWEEELSQETLTMAVGFPGDGIACAASGVRTGYDAEESKTIYLFTFPEDVGARELPLDQYQKNTGLWQSAWRAETQESHAPAGDPTPYDAVLYLLYREPAHLPLCYRTFFLDADPYGKVWRAEFATPLSGICSGLPESGEQVSVPDLPGEWAAHGDILSLYRMGILRGVDDAGTFAGREWLTRGQAALMVDRTLKLFQRTEK